MGWDDEIAIQEAFGDNSGVSMPLPCGMIDESQQLVTQAYVRI
jgi:hypothetical protein